MTEIINSDPYKIGDSCFFNSCIVIGFMPCKRTKGLITRFPDGTISTDLTTDQFISKMIQFVPNNDQKKRLIEFFKD